MRLGIGHPGDKSRVSGYVLSDFAKGDAQWLEKLLDAVADTAPDLAKELSGNGDGNKFMTKVGLQMKPPPSWLPMHLLQSKPLQMLVRLLPLLKPLPRLMQLQRPQQNLLHSMQQRRLKQQQMPLQLKPEHKR